MVSTASRQHLARHAAIALGLVFGVAAPFAFAQPVAKNYPNKPIRMIVPFAAGGPVDIVGRLLIQKISVSMGQQIVLDNRGGGGSILGSEMVARAPADGYTWLLTTGSLTSIAAFQKCPVKSRIVLAVYRYRANLIPLVRA